LKDFDQLTGAVAAGRFTRAEADQFVERAREAEQRIASWESPFCDGWETWRPDQSWPLPHLPPDIIADY
jgi:hypothetical protein